MDSSRYASVTLPLAEGLNAADNVPGSSTDTLRIRPSIVSYKLITSGRWVVGCVIYMNAADIFWQTRAKGTSAAPV